MPVIEGTTDLKTFVGEYDFAVDGGANGNINLRTSVAIPNVLPVGSVIVSGYIEVDTVLAGAGTVAINSEGAGDLQAAAAFSAAPWSSTGRKSIVPAGTGATSVKTTAARSLQATIAGGPLTGGKFRVVVFVK